jgi:hypothetical protein
VNELLSKLCQFIGYGSPHAKVIFIGIEEYTDDSNRDLYEKRLNIQSSLKPYTDLDELCIQLTDGLHNPQNSEPQFTWRPLCSVMLGIDDNTIDRMDDRSAIIEYQRTKLGKKDGDSLLAELLPVPKSKVNSFGEIHRSLLGIPRFDGAVVDDDALLNAYRELVLAQRRKLLAKMLAERFARSPPRLVVAYGRPWLGDRPWGQFKAVFRQTHQMLHEEGQMRYAEDDRPINFKGRITPRFEWAKMKKCLFVLTYHPACPDDRKFDAKVAKRIAELYREHIATP